MGSGRRPLLLVTNDDGIEAPGLWDLVRAVEGLGEIAVVAPAREQSWSGRAHRSDPGTTDGGDLIRSVISVRHSPPSGFDPLHCCVAVAATPARCVRLALTGLGLQPTLVLSGINPGFNGGALLTTSGTLGCAWEAAGSGIGAIAFSRPEGFDVAQTAAVREHARAIVARTLAQGMPDGTAILNVNFPQALRSDADWVLTMSSTGSMYTHAMTPVESENGMTVWSLQFVLTSPEEAEPDSEPVALAGGDVALTMLPARHGLPAAVWGSQRRSRRWTPELGSAPGSGGVPGP